MAGRSNFGGGLLKIQTYEVSDLFCLEPKTITFEDQAIFASSSWEMLEPSNERRAIDAIVFDALGLTQGERDAVYEAVINLVEARHHKAKSLKRQKEIGKRMKAAESILGIWVGLPEKTEEDEF